MVVQSIGMDKYESIMTVPCCPGGVIGIQGGGGTASSTSIDTLIVEMDGLTDADGQESPWTVMFADDPVKCTVSRERLMENPQRWQDRRMGSRVERLGDKERR